MTTTPLPGFGQADLSNCEREQIHLAGSIQPYGALLVVREADHTIIQASANAATVINLGDGHAILGFPLKRLKGNLLSSIKVHLQEDLYKIPIAVRCKVGDTQAEFDCLLHRTNGESYIIELENAGPAIDVEAHVRDSLRAVVDAASLPSLCDATASIFKQLTGYDRVMVYRFDDLGHGEVFAEQREPHLESFLGNRYPASDIPQIARKLYLRNRIRLLSDIDYEPSPVQPPRSPLTDQELDMSLCFLRSMSPIHIQYLKNMGVSATLVISLVVGGKLWGLVACHHYSSRIIHYELRAVCEVLAETIATRIAALESYLQVQAEFSVRRLEQRMIEAISRDGDWQAALFESPSALLQPLSASGAALLFEGQTLTVGNVPSTQDLKAIGQWLDEQRPAETVSTTRLSTETPMFSALKPIASGLLAKPLSQSPGEYLIWFRPEQIQTIVWGGNPFKPLEPASSTSELSPRQSFSQWHQLVEGTSESWSQTDLTAARLIRESVADVIHQFRSVRILIAQDQLAKISRHVQQAENPVIISDADGYIVFTNDSLYQLLALTEHNQLHHINDLIPLFATNSHIEQRWHDLLYQQKSWRGETTLVLDTAGANPVLIRADPVFSNPGDMLGYVILFTDGSERKLAETARRLFQEDVVKQQKIAAIPADNQAQLAYRNLLSLVVNNAQLAALEITDGVELAQVPKMLTTVQDSIARTAMLLEHLSVHAAQEKKSAVDEHEQDDD